MKIYGIISSFVLAVLVIKSEAKKGWLPDVSDYNRFNAETGYAGIFNIPVTGLKVSGGCNYQVHLLNRGEWLPEVNGNNIDNHDNGYAGTVRGDVIDGVAISCNVEYAVHIQGGNWLPSVNKHDIGDDENGYAGILGKPIDAVMIKGRTYATSYNDGASDDNNDHKDSNNNVNKSELLKKAEAAADYARDHNQRTVGNSRCLGAVDDALEHGGHFPYKSDNSDRLSDAYMMHDRLIELGFSELPEKPNPLKKGDICITERNASWPSGHIQIYDGVNWYSDFKQYSEFVYYYDQPPNHYYRILN